MENTKQYGLMLPKKNQLSAPKVGNVFGNDDDSEEEGGTDWVKKALKAENEKNKIKKQTQLDMQKALQEDPTIYQYDEVYDEMERTKEEEKTAKKVEKKAKYIGNLLKSAELRKKEQELRKDRVIQKEIEAEDAMFPDKERYVTSSYKAKLEEMRKFEDEQEYKDKLEAIGDVTKQNDMSGFYRHLYRQTVEKNEADLGITQEIKKPSELNETSELTSDIDKDDPIPSDSESEKSIKSNNENQDALKNHPIVKIKKKRQYRKRDLEVSESESEDELEKEKEKTESVEENKLSQIEEEPSESIAKKLKLSDDNKHIEAKSNNLSSVEESNEDSQLNSKESEKNSKTSNGITENKHKTEEIKKINIWQKRTVGPVFEAALQRYLFRKQEKLAVS